MTERRRRKFIGSLNVGGGLLETVDEVKEEVRSFFSAKFEEPDFDRPLMDGHPV